jgi:outer membrane protein TolC
LRRQAEVERDLARNQLLPGLDVVVAASYDLGSSSDPNKLAALRGPTLEASLVLDVPIQNRVARGRVTAAEAALTRIDAQREFARDRLAADVRDALAAMEAAYDRVSIARREVEVAERLAQAERTRFELGDGTLLFVNIRETAAAEARVRVVDALADYYRGQAAYRFALGRDVDRMVPARGASPAQPPPRDEAPPVPALPFIP